MIDKSSEVKNSNYTNDGQLQVALKLGLLVYFQCVPNRQAPNQTLKRFLIAVFQEVARDHGIEEPTVIMSDGTQGIKYRVPGFDLAFHEALVLTPNSDPNSKSKTWMVRDENLNFVQQGKREELHGKHIWNVITPRVGQIVKNDLQDLIQAYNASLGGDES